MSTTDLFGWMGAAFLLGSFYLVTEKKVDSRSVTYQVMNLVGATGISINAIAQRALPALVVEIVWALYALYTLRNILREKRAPQDPS